MHKSIVVVHGVGSPSLGAEIKSIVDAACSDGSFAEFQIIRKDSEDIPMCRITLDSGHVDLYEMNWSHTIAQPREGFWACLLHLFYLIFAMLHIADSGWHNGPSDEANTPAKTVGAPSVFGRIFRWILLTVTIWAPIAAASVIIAQLLKGHYVPAVFVLGSLAIAVGLMSWRLSKIDRLAIAGLIWCLVFLVVGMLIVGTDLDRKDVRDLIGGAVMFGVFGPLIVGIAGVIQSFQRAFTHAPAAYRRRQALLGASLFVLPYLLIGLTWGPIVFALQFLVVDLLAYLPNLESLPTHALYSEVVRGLPYNVVFMELVNACALLLTLMFLVIGVLAWSAGINLGFVKEGRWGENFRTGASIWLAMLLGCGAVVLPALALQEFLLQYQDLHLGSLALVSKMVASLSIGNSAEPAGQLAPNDLEIYRLTMWRFLPALVLLSKWLRPGLIVACQIVFYLCPRWSAICTREVLEDRFNQVVDLAAQRSGEAPIVLAYSQGSKISADAIASQKTKIKKLVTIGSPIGVLHENFLSLQPVPIAGSWHNLYRDSDFIGGSIATANARNTRIDQNFERSHFDYYQEEAVLKELGLRD